MKKIIKDIVPYLKLKDKADLPWYKKLNIYHEIIIATLFYAWIVIQIIYPKFFIYEYNYKNIHLYSYIKIPNQKKLHQEIDKALKPLNKHHLVFDAKETINMYIGDDILFYLSMYPGLQFLYMDTIARTINGEMFMRNFNAQTMNMKDNKGDIAFYKVLSHELVHIWQSQNYAIIGKFLWRKTWVLEGYAVYASESQDSRLQTDTKIKSFLQKYYNNSKSFREKGSYSLWGLMIKHAIEKMHKSVDDLHLGKVEYDEVLDSLLNEYNITKIKK